MPKWRPCLSAFIDYSKLSLTKEEGFLLSRIDGSTTTEELAQLTGREELDLVRSLGKLVDKGALEGGLVAAACILEAQKHAPAPAPAPALDIGWPEDPTQVDPEEPEIALPFQQDDAAPRAGSFDAETEETDAPEFEDGGSTLVDALANEEPDEGEVPTEKITVPRAPGSDPES
jgi:hypothetical protein